MQIDKVDTSTIAGKVYAFGAFLMLLGGMCFAVGVLIVVAILAGLI